MAIEFPIPRTLLLVVAAMLAACAAVAPDQDAGELLVVEFQIGGEQVSVELDPAAAPQAVKQLRESLQRGAWNGIRISWLAPNRELRSEAPAGYLPLPAELNAEPFALDAQRIETLADAMRLMERSLEPALLRRGERAGTQLREWVAEWRRSFDATFLLGLNRRQINEALGYTYRTGLQSRRALRGSVALVPGEPGETTLALAFLLRDQPQRDGRWVVVGQVRSGLEALQRLSRRARMHPRSQQPIEPLLIEQAEVISHRSRRGSAS